MKSKQKTTVKPTKEIRIPDLVNKIAKKILKDWNLLAEIKDKALIKDCVSAIEEAYIKGCIDGKSNAKLFEYASNFCFW